jgi:subtilisin family serine protease
MKSVRWVRWSVVAAWWLVALMVFSFRAASPALAQDGYGAQQVGVIVALWPPPEGVDMQAQADMVAQSQDSVLASVSSAEFQLAYRYQIVPGMAGTVTQSGLQALLSNPQVRAVAFDLPVEAALGESTKIIGADRIWSDFGLSGAGVNVAVLDSGFDVNHPDINSSVIAQHCFNHGTCPPGSTNEGESARDENGHGTHVTGIISSRGGIAPRGIAPSAGIVAVRVLNNAGNGWTSDVVAGIDWVVANQARLNVRVMNLSLGGGTYAGSCDSSDANSILYATAVQAARQAGIVVFAAAGNGALIDKLMTPACVSSVMAVGSTYDANLGPFTWGGANPICSDATTAVDQVTCTSNSSPELDLLAPGALITSAGLGGGTSNRSGTSMATPHASGVAALLVQAQPGLTPAQIESLLRESGVPIADPRNGRVTPRIDAYAAVQRLTGAASTTSTQGTVLLQSRSAHNGTSINATQEPCGQPPSGNPIAATDAQGHFQISIGIGQAPQCLWAIRQGYLTAQRAAPTGSIGTVTLLAGDVNGDDTINIFDMAAIAGRYGSADPIADFNGDGVVNVFDLALTAANYEKSGPLTDWQ